MELTPEEEAESKRRSDALFQASVIPSAQQPNLALLQAEPGQVGGVNMMPPPPPAVVSSLPGGSPGPGFTPDEDAKMRDLSAHHDDVNPIDSIPAADPPSAGPASIEPTVRKPTAKSGGRVGGVANPFAKTKEEALAEGSQLSANEATADAAAQKTNAVVQAAQDEVQGKKDAEAIRAKQEADERQRREAFANLEKAHADFSAQRREEIQKKDLTSYWEDRSTGSKILSALAVGLGGFASGLTGGPNQALTIIQHSMAQDAALKEKKLRAHLDSLDLDDKAYAHQLELGRAEIGIDHQGILEKLAGEADIRAAKAKVPEAQANGAALAASLKQEEARQAQANADRGRAIIGQTVDYQLKKADIGIRGSEAASRSRVDAAQIRHLDAESNLANAKADNPDGTAGAGRAIGKQMDKAQLAEHGGAAIKTIDELAAKGVTLSEKDRILIQNNRAELKKREGGGVWANLIPGSILARQQFQGLTPEKQRLANALDVLASKWASVTSVSHDAHELQHARDQADFLAPGQGADILNDKMGTARQLVGAAKALSGRQGGIAERGAEAGLDAAPARKPLSSAEIASLNKFIKANPNDPRSAQARQLLAGGM